MEGFLLKNLGLGGMFDPLKPPGIYAIGPYPNPNFNQNHNPHLNLNSNHKPNIANRENKKFSKMPFFIFLNKKKQPYFPRHVL